MENSRQVLRYTLKAIKQRCKNPRNKSYANYGGRGITLCERWETLENFIADVGDRPKGMTLERIDNNKGYEPGNCRWASRQEQAENQRRTVVLTFNGETRTVTQWSKITGISSRTIRKRLSNLGYTVEQTLTKPSVFGLRAAGKTYKPTSEKAKQNIPKGETSHWAKLSSKQVKDMRELHNSGKYTLKQLGEIFGVSSSSASFVVRRKTYKEA